MGLSYEESKKTALRIILILAVITIFEVFFALLGKGHISEGIEISPWIMGGVMIFLSMLKAYLIVYEFMHMKYEVPGLVKSVLLPMFLLVWGVIAFLAEGQYWNNNRAGLEEKNSLSVEEATTTGQVVDIKNIDLR